MKLVMGLIVSVSMFACSKEKAKTDSTAAATVATTPTGTNSDAIPSASADDTTYSGSDSAGTVSDGTDKTVVTPGPFVAALFGSWVSGCQALSFGSNDVVSPRGSTMLLTFDDKNALTVKQSFFVDIACSKPYSQEIADANLATFEEIDGSAATPDVIQYFKDLVSGYLDTQSYTASQPVSGAVGTIDITANGTTDYSSYRIVANTLFLATTCAQESDPAQQQCTVIGESADRRSDNFIDQSGFKRVN